MKYFHIMVCAILATGFTLPAQAESMPTSIAVVDIQSLMTESKAAKTIQEQVKSYQDKFLSELKKKEEALRGKEKDVLEQRNTLDKEAFAKKRNEFEAELIEARQYAQSRKRALDTASAKALGRLRGEIFKVVQQIADEKKFDLVLSRQHVVLGAKSIDISDEAMDKLNSAIKDIKVTIEKK